MKLEFENFGQISRGEIEIGDLTIICGPNSSGKTYASYAIHSFLRNFQQLARAQVPLEKFAELEKDGTADFDLKPYFNQRQGGFRRASERFLQNINSYYSVAPGFFEGAKLLVTPPAGMSIEGMRRASAIFSEAGLRGFKERGSEKLVVSTDSKESQVPGSYARNVIGTWLARASIGYSVPTPFAITSERTGVSLFYRDLDVSRNQLFEQLSQQSGKDIDFFQLAFATSSRYALPIKENIDTVRGFETIAKSQSMFDSEEDKFGVIAKMDELLCGGFSSEANQLTYAFKVKGVRKKKKIPIHAASSAVKSLFLLNTFVRFVAQPGSALIFDEPELNLHPSNQRKIAALIVRLVNSGVKVVITTHSDFVVREISSRIALFAKSGSAAEFVKANNLEKYDLIDPKKVRAFSTSGNIISPVPVTGSGIEMGTLNDAIGASNDFFEDALLV